MGQVYRGGQRPVIRQNFDTLELVDWGDFFTQDDGQEHIDRHAVQWEREHLPAGSGAWEVIPPSGPQAKREKWETWLPSETPDNAKLKLGPENVGRRFRAQTWGGYGPSGDGGVDYVEWGNSDGSHANDDVPSTRSYSEVLVVKEWAAPPTAPPPPVTAAATRAAMVAAAKAWEHTQPGPTPLARITIARMILERPDHAATGKPGWLHVREAVLAVLSDSGEL